VILALLVAIVIIILRRRPNLKIDQPNVNPYNPGGVNTTGHGSSGAATEYTSDGEGMSPRPDIHL
jgi:hypothetical protein